MLNKGYILDDKYEVIKVLGTGGMGTVYLCNNNRLNNLWAIKETKKNDKIDINITTESNILKNLNYPGIPKIIDIFYENNNFYMVEEYIEGRTLKEYVQANNYLDVENICHIISSICDIMKYLHSFDPPIIYRDLKPSNIMITPSGKVVLIDFGISKIYKADNNDDTVSLGSQGYAAPEQSGLGQSCKQTDIYGIGMVMYFMATGKVSANATEPFGMGNYVDNTDEDLKKIIQKCVQGKISDRYTSVEELQGEIEELLNKSSYDKTMLLDRSKIKVGKKITSSKLRQILIGMIAIVAIIFIIVYFSFMNKKANDDKKVTDKPTTEATTPAATVTPTPTPTVAPTSPPLNQAPDKGKGGKKK